MTGAEQITDGPWVAVRREPNGRIRVTIKWALTRWILLVGFVLGLPAGFLVGKFT